MGYYKRRSTRKETTAQSLARYKRQQEKQRKAREARRIRELEDRMPGGILNPMTPKWCKFSEYPTISLAHSQVRYRGTTELNAHLKGTEPAEFKCTMQGHCKRVEVTREQHAAWMSRVCNVRFGKRWYRHPITSVSYEEFCNRYHVYERHTKYLD